MTWLSELNPKLMDWSLELVWYIIGLLISSSRSLFESESVLIICMCSCRLCAMEVELESSIPTSRLCSRICS